MIGAQALGQKRLRVFIAKAKRLKRTPFKNFCSCFGSPKLNIGKKQGGRIGREQRDWPRSGFQRFYRSERAFGCMAGKLPVIVSVMVTHSVEYAREARKISSSLDFYCVASCIPCLESKDGGIYKSTLCHSIGR